MNRRGFTLVELIVVLTILAVTTGLAIPAFRRWVEEDNLTVATRRIEALFRMARDSAIRSGSAVTLVLDSATAHAWLIPSAGNGSEIETAQTDGDAVDLPQSVTLRLSKTRALFRFAAGGAVFGDSLWLTTPYESRLITLDPWTGDVIGQP